MVTAPSNIVRRQKIINKNVFGLLIAEQRFTFEFIGESINKPANGLLNLGLKKEQRVASKAYPFGVLFEV